SARGGNEIRRRGAGGGDDVRCFLPAGSDDAGELRDKIAHAAAAAKRGALAAQRGNAIVAESDRADVAEVAQARIVHTRTIRAGESSRRNAGGPVQPLHVLVFVRRSV